jgi:hypothetical protein
LARRALRRLDETLTTCHKLGVTVVVLRLRRDLAATLAHYGLLERVAVYTANAAAVAAAGNIAAASELLSMPIEPNHLIDVMPRTR